MKNTVSYGEIQSTASFFTVRLQSYCDLNGKKNENSNWTRLECGERKSMSIEWIRRQLHVYIFVVMIGE